MRIGSPLIGCFAIIIASWSHIGFAQVEKKVPVANDEELLANFVVRPVAGGIFPVEHWDPQKTTSTDTAIADMSALIRVVAEIPADDIERLFAACVADTQFHKSPTKELKAWVENYSNVLEHVSRVTWIEPTLKLRQLKFT